jgi:outer membrane immunogenic protein
MKLEGSAFDPLISASRSVASFRGTPDVLGSAKVGDWYGMITGRLGYTWGRTLIYVKGGAAFVPVQASVLDQCNTTATGCGNWLTSTSASTDTVTTATLGGGVEWAFADNWSIKGEYMFIGIGDNHSLSSCGNAIAPAGNVVGGGPFCFNHEFGGIHTAKVGLNYRFGGLAAPY